MDTIKIYKVSILSENGKFSQSHIYSKEIDKTIYDKINPDRPVWTMSTQDSYDASQKVWIMSTDESALKSFCQGMHFACYLNTWNFLLSTAKEEK